MTDCDVHFPMGLYADDADEWLYRNDIEFEIVESWTDQYTFTTIPITIRFKNPQHKTLFLLKWAHVVL